MRISRLLSVALVAALWAEVGAAQNVVLNPYVAPLTSEDGIALNRPRALRHRQSSALAVIDYADDPLVVEARSGEADTETARLVRRAATAHTRFSFGLYDRLVVTGGIDVVLAMTGESFFNPRTRMALKPHDGPGLGDARLGARYVPFGSADSMVSAAVQAQLTFPLAEAAAPSQNLSGEDTLSFRPELLFEVKPGAVRFNATLGAVVRKNGDLLGTTVGDQLTFGAGLAAELPGKLKVLQLLAETHGATGFSNFFGRETTPVELLFGARAALGQHFRLGFSGGPGLTRGLGTPDYRVLATLAFTAIKVFDKDGDGINDRYDRCDSEPEDRDGIDDADGCPDVDTDEDGVDDTFDHCPGQQEDHDKYQDYDGCPEPDNDRDGLDDAADACPLEPEDRDGFEDDNGCPDIG